MVQNFELSNVIAFIENVDLIIAEGWMILMQHPCIVDVMPQVEERLIFAHLDLFEEQNEQTPSETEGRKATFQMKLWIPVSLAKHVCEKFYGKEHTLDLEMISESIGELLNIIAGNLMGIVNKNAALGMPVVEMDCSSVSGVNGVVRSYSTPLGSFTFGIEHHR